MLREFYQNEFYQDDVWCRNGLNTLCVRFQVFLSYNIILYTNIYLK